jgi:hypothetical protein
MLNTNEIKQFEDVRVQVRAYMCLLLNRSIPNYLPEPSIDVIMRGLKEVKKENINLEAMYILDPRGIQILDAISINPHYTKGKGENQSSRAYYYKAVRSKKCVITNPYPSTFTNDLTVTASYPIYDQNKKLKFIVCIDIALKEIIKFAHPTSLDTIFGYLSKSTYAIFSLSLAFVSFLLFFHGLKSIATFGFSIERLEIKQLFESTILLTLSLAIFDLVKTIFEEEVLGHTDGKSKDIHRTMIKFLGSIIIALSIEALMLVFKFALIGPEKIIFAVYLIGGVTMLLFGLSFYLKSTDSRKQRGD